MEPTEGGDETQRYRRSRLLESEFIYGKGFQSPGGEDAVGAFATGLELRPGMRVLDIGSGTGGAARYLARTFGVEVVGVDYSTDCVVLATERAREEGLDRVTFLQMDAQALAVEPRSFDRVWTRDSLVCIEDKDAVLRGLHRALRPGGTVFATDFCIRPGVSADFARYATDCGWWLPTLDGYREAIVAAGFEAATLQDVSSDLARWLRLELAQLEAGHSQFADRFGEAAYERLRERWGEKIRFCGAGDLVWAKLTCRRPHA